MICRYHIRSRAFILLLLLTVLYPACYGADTQRPNDDEMRTALIYNFIRYVTKENYVKKDTIVLGIYGDNPVTIKTVATLNNEKIRNNRIVVKVFEKPADIKKVDILYVMYDFNFEMSRVYRQVKGSSVLLVSDRYDDKKEVMINFTQESGKIQFEINTKNISEEKFAVAPKLMLLGGTELDIRELYKETARTLVSERERAEQIETELQLKLNEMHQLTIKLEEMQKRNSELDQVIKSQLESIALQKNNLDSLAGELILVSAKALSQKQKLDSTNAALYQTNQMIGGLDVQLEQKHAELQKTKEVLESLVLEVEEKERTLEQQGYRIRLQNIAIYIFIAFFALFVLFILYIYHNFKVKKAQNIELEKRNKKINRQKEMIQEQTEELIVTNFELEKLSIVAEKTDNAVIIMDSEGKMEWVNKSFQKMTGYAMDGFIDAFGKNLIETLDKKTRAAIKEICLKKKQPLTYESQIVSKSNETKWLQTNITPIVNEFNEIVKLVAIDSDITKLKNAEVKILNKNKQIEENSNKLQAQADELMMANKELELQKNRAEDTLSKLKNAQSQLVAAEKMVSLGQLTSGIAHEINNPINYISSSIEGLRYIIDDVKNLLQGYDEILNGAGDDRVNKLKQDFEYNDLIKGFEELSNNIKLGVDRTKEIVNSLRTFSRVDEDNFVLADIHKNLDSALVLLGKQNKEHIEVVKNYDKLPEIECIQGKINQVFMNILVNSIQAIKNEGKIEISTAEKIIDNKNYVEIVFNDTGIGMTKEVKEKIFEPFFTTKDVGEGTGLGLSITYSIIKKHKGIIEVESEPGKGSTFKIYLPFKREK